MRLVIVSAIAACVLGTLPVLAQIDSSASRIPVPLRGTVAGFDFKCNGNRSYPDIEARGEREGWVNLRFTSKADGSIADIEVMNLFGSQDFAEAAVRGLGKCRIINPQLENGIAVDTANVPFRFFYRIMAPDRRGTPGIAAQMQTVQGLIAAGDLNGADAALDKAEADSTRLYEFANILLRRAAIIAKRGRPDMALRYIEQIPGDSVLATAERVELLRTRLGLELSLGLAAAAEQTVEKLQQAGGDLKGDPLQDALTRLRAIRQSGQPLAVSGRISAECRPFVCDPARPDWSYIPSHRTLSLTDVKGRVDTVSIRCDRKTYAAKAAADVTWTIPAKWGNCRFSVNGEPGTTFTLIDETPPG